MKNGLNLFLIGILMIATGTASAKSISVSGQVGWASPQGSLFTQDGEDLAGGGLGYGADVMYQSESILNGKLGLGVSFNGAALIAVGETLDGFRFYGLSVYGAKAQYTFLTGSFRPYAALELGLGVLSTPEVSSGGEVILPAEYGFSLGLRPEIGFETKGGFRLSYGFQLPFSYKIEEFFEGSRTAGATQISIGYRKHFEL